MSGAQPWSGGWGQSLPRSQWARKGLCPHRSLFAILNHGVQAEGGPDSRSNFPSWLQAEGVWPERPDVLRAEAGEVDVDTALIIWEGERAVAPTALSALSVQHTPSGAAADAGGAERQHSKRQWMDAPGNVGDPPPCSQRHPRQRDPHPPQARGAPQRDHRRLTGMGGTFAHMAEEVPGEPGIMQTQPHAGEGKTPMQEVDAQRDPCDIQGHRLWRTNMRPVDEAGLEGSRDVLVTLSHSRGGQTCRII